MDIEVADIITWVVMHKWWLIAAVPIVIAVVVVRTISN